MSDLTLVFPPFAYSAFSGPHLAPALLRGLVEQHGTSCATLDLNIRLVHTLQEPRWMRLVEERVLGASDERFTASERAMARWLPEAVRNGSFQRYPYVLRQVLRLLREVLLPFPDEVTELCGRDLRGPVRDALYEPLVDMVLDTGCKAVGFSVAFGEQLPEAMVLASMLAQRRPGLRIALGGAQVNLLAAEHVELLSDTGLFDLVFLGNAEAEAAALLGALAAGRSVPRIRRAEPIGRAELQHLPRPEFNADEFALYFGGLALPVLVSKGCYWGKCTFCDYAKMNRFCTSHSITRQPLEVLGEINTNREATPASRIMLISDAVSPSFYKKLAVAAIREGVRLDTWSYMLHHRNLDKEFFALLNDAGVQTVNFGSETTVERLLQLMNKAGRTEDIRNNLVDAHEAGLKTVMNLIVDFPSCTFAEAVSVADDVIDLGEAITVLNPQVFDLTADTAIAKNPEHFGLDSVAEGTRWSSHGYHSLASRRVRGMTPGQRETAISIFFKLASGKRLKRRLATLPQTVNADDMLAFDPTALFYQDDGPTIELLSIRRNWRCGQREWEYYKEVARREQRHVQARELERALGRSDENTDLTAAGAMTWSRNALDSGLVNKIERRPS